MERLTLHKSRSEIRSNQKLINVAMLGWGLNTLLIANQSMATTGDVS